MKKCFAVLALSLGLAFSPLCALESKSLSQSDIEFLFVADTNSLNVLTLSDEEMNLTQGEFFGSWFIKWINPKPICCFLRK
ncbi:hypothetical protein OQH61_08795 [Helicobacter sp. MIT 21-1697]|uniref:hypothetical protein n=1 Tax=Helicobacter sp. MIT 21-1697 TaxID=2993733 RepID=UPI00224ADDB6|nr:hypothetical protein [Helicobacter sp. MIT 21-1697]MCX2717828.1 hypothetical protein [Helicobacter sp. MIT 21-1697]